MLPAYQQCEMFIMRQLATSIRVHLGAAKMTSHLYDYDHYRKPCTPSLFSKGKQVPFDIY